MNLSPTQAEAVCHGEGPMLVLAGPGSGKTTIITGRVQYLTTRHGIPPEQILVITFTKAAATQMQQRFRLLTHETSSAVTFGTFHAVFFQILRYACNYNAESIIKDSESLKILTDILSKLNSSLSEEPELVQTILQEISLYKGNHSLEPPEIKKQYLPKSCDAKTFFSAYEKYNEELRNRRKVDFEDMLLETRNLLLTHPEILSHWQKRYRYLLIDEFQDINRLQYEIVRMLAAPENNLFIVGDDDQSIYGFRGSKPEIMLQFPKDYPSAKTVILGTNYRSAPPIVAASQRLISFNKNRYEKKLTAQRADGPPVQILTFEDCAEENSFLIASIQNLHKNGKSGIIPSDSSSSAASLFSENIPLSQIAILYRTNRQPRSLIEALRQAGIPYTIRGTVPCLYNHVHVLPVLAYLRLATGEMKRSDMLLVANRPVRYLNRQAFPTPVVDLNRVRESYLTREKPYVAERIQRLQYDLSMIARMNPFAAIHYICKIVGYEKHLTDTVSNPSDALEIMSELLEASRNFLTIRDFLTYTEQTCAKYKEENSARKQPDDGVNLMTYHSSKGLEFSYVFLIDCNETIVPHLKCLLPEQICEERRLLYVAMTRAKEQLTLMSVRKRNGKDMKESRFLAEIREEDSQKGN